jgi:hypothetical protein
MTGHIDERERGFLRSGTRFAARNNPYYFSVEELLSHHKRLLVQEPAVTTRATRIAGLNFGSLLQTTVRFRMDSSLLKSTLRTVFFDLFREHEESGTSGFEVVVTFNAILTNQDASSFSLFYGHDHRADNVAGAAPELKFGGTTIIRTLLDLDSIPTTFDSEKLIHSHRHAFENSNVRIHSFLNVVYLIYRFIENPVVRTVVKRRRFLRDAVPEGAPSLSRT